MKLETKKWIEKGVIWFAPIFTLLMFLLPWMGYYKEQSTITDEYRQLYSFYELLKFDVSVMTSIVMWVSLIGVIASIVLYILSVVLKNKEKLFTRIGAITLVASTGILFLMPMFKKNMQILSGVEINMWVDFMTIPYAFLIIYNVGSLIYIYKKMYSKKD